VDLFRSASHNDALHAESLSMIETAKEVLRGSELDEEDEGTRTSEKKRYVYVEHESGRCEVIMIQ
jgi:hypothetical protein